MRTDAIDTLIDDIYGVLTGRLKPSPIVDDVTSNADFAKRVIGHIHSDLVPDTRLDRDPREVYVTQFSNPCHRKAWFERNKPTALKEHAISGHGKYKFLYGDLIEESFLYLAKAAGHEVTDTQRRFSHELPFSGALLLAGRIDACIDGWLVDVKSADPFTFDRVAEGKYDDKFGYEQQLQSYLWLASKEGIEYKGIANIFINKVNGKMHVLKWNAMPNFRELESNLRDFEEDMLDKDITPHPVFALKDDGVLSTTCSYCPFKFECYGDAGLRVYAYSSGPQFVATSMSKKKIKVPDITSAYMKQADVRNGNGPT